MELDDVFNAIEATEPAPEDDAAATFNDKYDKYIADLYTEMCSWSEPKREAMLNDAHQRFSDVLPLRTVKNTTVALVGAGGLGNWIWRVLLGMGFTNLYLFDDDTVGPENIGPQAHNLIDVGYPKVEAVRRAALAFRGVNIRTFKQRVQTFSEIAQCMGCTPDVVVGATDSTAFRNSMISDVCYNRAKETQLFIDLRMSLGDWNAYITTPKLFANTTLFSHILNQYEAEACFTEEEAVHEPCTARAITYTGANVASYVGAFLHWWLTVGHTQTAVWMYENFYKSTRANGSTFNWRYTYSSRDFYAETKTAAEESRIERVNTMEPELNAYRNHLYIRWGIKAQDDDKGMYKAYHGLNADGQEMLLLTSGYGTEWSSLNLSEGKAVHTKGKPAVLPVAFQHRNPGWMTLAKLFTPQRNYPNVCQLLSTAEDEYLFVVIGDDASLYKITLTEDNTIVFGERVLLYTLLNERFTDCQYTAKYEPGQELYVYNEIIYTLPSVLPGIAAASEPEPEPEPVPEEPGIMHTAVQLVECSLGDTVVFNGKEYEVAGYEDARCAMVRLNGLAAGTENLIVPSEAEVVRD